MISRSCHFVYMQNYAPLSLVSKTLSAIEMFVLSLLLMQSGVICIAVARISDSVHILSCNVENRAKFVHCTLITLLQIMQ